MAATATEKPPTSSGGSVGGADSYIGSLISLTSKSEIRYEGVLYNINAHDSTIGLSNVRSFGTEGRRRDGPDIPPSERVYEFILFRGSDIKDLQVTSSPQVQPAAYMYNDPAIIQSHSHYPQAPTSSMAQSLPSAGVGSQTDLTSHASSHGLPRPALQDTVPPYQPGGNVGSWGAVAPPPITNVSGLPAEAYWKNYYRPSSELQVQQQTSFQPAPMPQGFHHPAVNAANFSMSQMSENPNLLPPVGINTLFFSPSMPSAQSSTVVSESANLIPDKASLQTLHTVPANSNLPSAPPLNIDIDRSTVNLSDSEVAAGIVVPVKSISESACLSSLSGTSNGVLTDGTKPILVTPGQFLQPGLPTATLLQSSQTTQKDVEVVRISSLDASAAMQEIQEPLLPLPTPSDLELHGYPSYNRQGARGGRERRYGNGISRSATRFNEDFDFNAMNEKFNKEEVWGHLGKSNRFQEDGDGLIDDDEAGVPKPDAKPVYNKDDFFDSISCDALGGGSRGGRGRFSEQMRRDTETFGGSHRYWGGRGGRWQHPRGGRSRGGGGYHGRGYGHGGWGRSYNNSSNGF